MFFGLMFTLCAFLFFFVAPQSKKETNQRKKEKVRN